MKVGVVGAGTMGVGIALVAAAAGEQVVLTDVSAATAASGLVSAQKQLARRREKGLLNPEEEAAIAGRITVSGDISGLAPCELVIEAIVEKLEVKRELFRGAATVCQPDALLATNTSSLPVTAIAASVSQPERVLGLHFFNPAPLLPLVEVVSALQTAEETAVRGAAIAARWGKTPVRVRDTPGFIVNRVARPFYTESLRILEEGIADEATIDHAMKVIGGFKMGPFELIDLIGNDINAATTESVFRGLNYDARFRPSLRQQQLLQAGYLGRKSGRGFFAYGDGAEKPSPRGNEALYRRICERVVTMLINEAVDAVFWSVAGPEEIDRSVTLGVNYPKGLIAWGEEIGWEEVLHRLELLREEYCEERYRPSPLLRRAVREGRSPAAGPSGGV